MKVIISPLAQQQIRGAANWYNKQQKGLGTRFTKSIRDVIKTLQINPYYEIRYDDVRILNTKVFPYLVQYTVNEGANLITVFGVFHASRNPNTYIKRK